MDNNIVSNFNEYVKKYPLYSKEAIVNLMVEDGIISPATAKKIKSGMSLFLLEKPAWKTNVEEDLSYTKAMGATFSKTKPKEEVPQTKFNRNIENTFQSDTQGDCWLLSDINAMRNTEWGREIIRNAIVPDGKGGVTIKFPGSPLAQKNFHISPKEIAAAKASGHYSTGDDDMIALELATEKLSKQMVKKGLAERVDKFDDVIGHPSYLTNIKLDKKNIDNAYLSISTLLTGRQRVEVDFLLGVKGSENILKYISQNPGKTAAVCTFDHYKDIFGTRDEDDPVHGNHAYAIQKIIYGKEVVVIDPYHTDKPIRLSWEKFINDVETIYAGAKDNTTYNALKKSVPAEHDTIRQQDHEQRLKSLKDIKNRRIAEETKRKNEKIDYEVKNIMSGLKFLKDDIKSNEERFGPDLYLNYNNYKSAMDKVNKDNVVKLLKTYPGLIRDLDTYKSGWGNGDDKKALIEPVINALTERAREAKIDNNTITQFRKNCMKELDAMFYTNIDVVISEVQNLLNLIGNK